MICPTADTEEGVPVLRGHQTRALEAGADTTADDGPEVTRRDAQNREWSAPRWLSLYW